MWRKCHYHYSKDIIIRVIRYQTSYHTSIGISTLEIASYFSVRQFVYCIRIVHNLNNNMETQYVLLMSLDLSTNHKITSNNKRNIASNMMSTMWLMLMMRRMWILKIGVRIGVRRSRDIDKLINTVIIIAGDCSIVG